MSTIPIFTAVRIIPRDKEFLDRKLGARGEIFYDRDANSLRLYDGQIAGGIGLSRSDLSNVDLEDFRKKSVESKLATVIYNVTVTGPQSLDTGNKYNLNAVYRLEPNFVVGYTYVFNQDDATNVYFPNATGTALNPHPLNFSADDISGELGDGTSYLADVRYFLDGNSVTQAVYNSSAFNTATSRQVQITVTNATPATLYYWCWNHTAMGNAISVADPGSGTGTDVGGVSVSVDTVAPTTPSQGNLWLNTTTGILYVYFVDDDSEQWIQPVFPYPDISNLATESYVDTAIGNIQAVNLTGLATEDYVDQAVSTVSVDLTGLATEDYVDTGISSLSFNLNSLTDVDTVSSPPTPGQVLKWTGTVWAPGVDVAEGGTGVDAETLSGFAGSYYLNYNNFTNRPDLTLLAPLNNPGFTGTVTGISATMVGLGNVTNESKATMFSSPTFTGTVTGISATMVGLGNVTNESKATMFSSPTFTGTTTLQQATEILNTKSAATGVVVHDFSTGTIWYHSSVGANFTANFTNVPTTNDRTISIALILSQGTTPYIPNAVQINESAVTINWVGGLVPTGNANKIDVVNFTLIRVSSAWTVISNLSSFG